MRKDTHLFIIGNKTYEAPILHRPPLHRLPVRILGLDLIGPPKEGEDIDEMQSRAIALANGDKARDICRVIATVILGAKAIKKSEERRSIWFGWLLPSASPLEALTDEIYFNQSITAMVNHLVQALAHARIADWAEMTTFLSGLRGFTAPTKK